MKKVSYTTKKEEEIDAIQYTGINDNEISDFVGADNMSINIISDNDTIVCVKNHINQFVMIYPRDWIVKTSFGTIIYDDNSFRTIFNITEEYSYRKCRPKQELEFVRFYDNNYDEIIQFIGKDNIHSIDKDCSCINIINTLAEKEYDELYPGGYIVKTIRGTFLVLSTLDFSNMYNIVE